MTSLKDRIVCITGASAGIGEACAKAFAAAGARLLLAARREDRLGDVARSLAAEYDTPTHRVTLDVRDREAVERAFADLPSEWTAIDVLVNNAGLARGFGKLHEGSIEDWDEMIDTNVKGLLYVSRAVVPGMVARGRGHVVNLGSIAGREAYPNGNVYCATKHAVDALTQGLRMDLVDTPVKVSTVDPGLVETEFSIVRFHGDAERAKKVYDRIDPLTGEDIADAVLYCVTRPAHVVIQQVVMTPVHQASAQVVFRG
jgi:3-hydroxy acid dehydrogenase / malonic semialdehyde reductase